MHRSGTFKPIHITDKCFFWPVLASDKKEVLFMVAYYFESGLGFGIKFSECGYKETWV